MTRSFFIDDNKVFYKFGKTEIDENDNVIVTYDFDILLVNNFKVVEFFSKLKSEKKPIVLKNNNGEEICTFDEVFKITSFHMTSIVTISLLKRKESINNSIGFDYGKTPELDTH